MLDIFKGALGFLKFDSVCIDNNVFRLHYKATVMILVICSLLVTSRQYIGDPIDCLVEVSETEPRHSSSTDDVLTAGRTWWDHGHLLLDPWHFLHH